MGAQPFGSSGDFGTTLKYYVEGDARTQPELAELTLIAEQVKAIRKAAGLRREEFAFRLEVELALVVAVENGFSTMADANDLLNLAETHFNKSS